MVSDHPALQAFFNDDALRVIRLLLTGGATPELEQILAEGVGLVQGTMSIEMQRARHRCRVGMLPLEDGVLSAFAVGVLVIITMTS